MKILKVTGGYPPAYAQGGTAAAAHSLMKELKALGNDVFVLTTNINGNDKLSLSGLNVFEGVPVYYCEASKAPIPYRSRELSVELKRRIMDFDVVLLDSSWTSYGICTGTICRKHRKPYLIYSHGCLAPERLNLGRFKKRMWWTLFDKHLYNYSQGAIALTDSEIDHLRDMGVNVPIYKVPNGVEIEDISTEEARRLLSKKIPRIVDNGYLLFLGRFDPIKGIDILLRSYKMLHDENCEIPYLVLAGPNDESYKDSLLKSVSSDIKDRIVVPGLVEGKFKSSLIKLAKIFVLPSKGEGLPVTALESLELGTPVILSNKCYLPDVTEYKAGIEVEPEEGELYRAIRWALSNQHELKEMASNGKRLVNDRFTWRRVSEMTLEVINKTLSGGVW